MHKLINYEKKKKSNKKYKFLYLISNQPDDNVDVVFHIIRSFVIVAYLMPIYIILFIDLTTSDEP